MGRTKNKANLTSKEKAEILRLLINGEKPMAIAKSMGLGQNTIYRVCKRKAGGIRTLLYGSAI